MLFSRQRLVISLEGYSRKRGTRAGGVFEQGAYYYASRLWVGLNPCHPIVFDRDHTQQVEPSAYR